MAWLPSHRLHHSIASNSSLGLSQPSHSPKLSSELTL